MTKTVAIASTVIPILIMIVGSQYIDSIKKSLLSRVSFLFFILSGITEILRWVLPFTFMDYLLENDVDSFLNFLITMNRIRDGLFIIGLITTIIACFERTKEKQL